MRGKKVLVAGGTGFLGGRMMRRLENEGITCVAASLSTGVDFRNIEQTKKLFKKEKPDIVINCAAFVGGIRFGMERGGELFFNNTVMSANLIECSRLFGVELFVNPIANCTYPNVSKYFKESNWWDGAMHESVLVYGLARKGIWVNAWAYNQQYGMRFNNLILASMYGPEDHFDEVRSHALGALVMKFIEAKRKNLPEVVVWGSGRPIREWMFVDDGVEALLLSLGMDLPIEPINIGCGKATSIKDLAMLIKKISGYKGQVIFDKSKPDGAPFKVFNIDRMKKIFKWTPPTALEEGIRKTIDWYESNDKKIKKLSK